MYKLANVDLTQLHGKSGRLYVSEQHVVFEGRDGSVTVLATAVKRRASRTAEETVEPTTSLSITPPTLEY